MRGREGELPLSERGQRKHTTLLVITGIICTPRNRKGPKPQAAAVPRIFKFVCLSVS